MKEASAKPSARSAKTSAIVQSLVTLVLAAFILGMINYLGFKYYKHIDLTQDQIYSLSSKSQEVVQEITAPVTVYMFPVFDVNTGQPDGGKDGQIFNLLQEYARASVTNKFVIERIDPHEDSAKVTALAKQVHITNAFNNLIIKMGDQYKLVDVSDLYDQSNPYVKSAPFKGEAVITADLMGLMDPKIPKIYFTSGHGEHDLKNNGPAGGSQLEQLLRQDGMDCLPLPLANQGDVPIDASAVVVLGPSTSFLPFEVDALSRYLEKNGHLIVLEDLTVKAGLDDLLAKYSLRFNNDTILTHIPQVNQTLPVAFILSDGFSGHPITAQFQGQNILMQLSGFRSVSNGFTNNKDLDLKTTYLLRTSESSSLPNWGMTKPLTATMTTDDLANMTFDPKTDNKPPLSVAALYDANFTPGAQKPSDDQPPSTKVIVFGGSSFLLNEEISRNPYPGNIFDNCLNWMTKKNPVLAIAPKPPQEYTISLTPMQDRTIAWFVIVFIPGIFLGLAVLTWFSRRK